jgi:hypothetical protein
MIHWGYCRDSISITGCGEWHHAVSSGIVTEMAEELGLVYTLERGQCWPVNFFCPSPETVGLHVCQLISPTYPFLCHPTLYLWAIWSSAYIEYLYREHWCCSVIIYIISYRTYNCYLLKRRLNTRTVAALSAKPLWLLLLDSGVMCCHY